MTNLEKLEQMQARGVIVRNPATVEVSEEVDPTKIGRGVVLHPGTRLRGEQLLILDGCELGAETPVTVDNCALGYRVKLAGGYHSNSVYLDDVSFASGAHVRGPSLLEEQATCAHTVGLKQTLLMPFVTLGSLINFCDILMAGGTSRRDHSEVGSSFIHFNFTPFGSHGDKATASLIGDVPQGVMLRSPRIFLGGQAGLVGPIQIGYGAMLAAGNVYRRECPPQALSLGEPRPEGSRSFAPLPLRRIRQKAAANCRYIGNLAALWHWYRRVRLGCAGDDVGCRSLYARGQKAIAAMIDERIKRLGQVVADLPASAELLKGGAARDQGESAAQQAFARSWPAARAHLEAYREHDQEDDEDAVALLEAIKCPKSDGSASTYLERIQALTRDSVERGTRWLGAVLRTTEDAPVAWPEAKQ